MHLPLRCRVAILGHKKKTKELINIFSVTQNKIEIYKYVTEPGIKLTGYKYSLFICTVYLYSLVNAFPYLLPCLQLANMTARGLSNKN